MSDTPTTQNPRETDWYGGFERPVGHAVVAMFVALLAGLVLNAQGLLATARQLPYGTTTRSVSITLLGTGQRRHRRTVPELTSGRPAMGAGPTLAGHHR